VSSELPDRAKAALDRLIHIAQCDTGQSRRVENFLFAWWNAEACGGFDLTERWGVDAPIAADMATVFAILPSAGMIRTPSQFEAIARAWRPAACHEETL